MANPENFLPDGMSMDQFIAQSSYQDLMQTYKGLILSADSPRDHTSPEVGAVLNGAIDKMIPSLKAQYEAHGLTFNADNFRNAVLGQHVQVNGRGMMSGMAPLDKFSMDMKTLMPDADTSALTDLTTTIDETNKSWKMIQRGMQGDPSATIGIYRDAGMRVWTAQNKLDELNASGTATPEQLKQAQMDLALGQNMFDRVNNVMPESMRADAEKALTDAKDYETKRLAGDLPYQRFGSTVYQAGVDLKENAILLSQGEFSTVAGRAGTAALAFGDGLADLGTSVVGGVVALNAASYQTTGNFISTKLGFNPVFGQDQSFGQTFSGVYSSIDDASKNARGYLYDRDALTQGSYGAFHFAGEWGVGIGTLAGAGSKVVAGSAKLIEAASVATKTERAAAVIAKSDDVVAAATKAAAPEARAAAATETKATAEILAFKPNAVTKAPAELKAANLADEPAVLTARTADGSMTTTARMAPTRPVAPAAADAGRITVDTVADVARPSVMPKAPRAPELPKATDGVRVAEDNVIPLNRATAGLKAPKTPEMPKAPAADAAPSVAPRSPASLMDIPKVPKAPKAPEAGPWGPRAPAAAAADDGVSAAAKTAPAKPVAPATDDAAAIVADAATANRSVRSIYRDPRMQFNDKVFALSARSADDPAAVKALQRLSNDLRAARPGADPKAVSITGLKATPGLPEDIGSKMISVASARQGRRFILPETRNNMASSFFKATNWGDSARYNIGTLTTPKGAATAAFNTASNVAFAPIKLTYGAFRHPLTGGFKLGAVAGADQMLTGGQIRDAYGRAYDWVLGVTGDLSKSFTGGQDNLYSATADTLGAGLMPDDTMAGAAARHKDTFQRAASGVAKSIMGTDPAQLAQYGFYGLAAWSLLNGQTMNAVIMGTIGAFLPQILEFVDKTLESYGYDIIPDSVYSKNDASDVKPGLKDGSSQAAFSGAATNTPTKTVTSTTDVPDHTANLDKRPNYALGLSAG